jgi:hypothetical protein
MWRRFCRLTIGIRSPHLAPARMYVCSSFSPSPFCWRVCVCVLTRAMLCRAVGRYVHGGRLFGVHFPAHCRTRARYDLSLFAFCFVFSSFTCPFTELELVCCVALRCVALRCVALRCVALRCVALCVQTRRGRAQRPMSWTRATTKAATQNSTHPTAKRRRKTQTQTQTEQSRWCRTAAIPTRARARCRAHTTRTTTPPLPLPLPLRRCCLRRRSAAQAVVVGVVGEG